MSNRVILRAVAEEEDIEGVEEDMAEAGGDIRKIIQIPVQIEVVEEDVAGAEEEAVAAMI
jgi:hypothetical protein